MPDKNEDLHCYAPDKADVALLLIAVINDVEFPEGDQFLHFAVRMARRLAHQAASQGGRRPRDLRQRQLRTLAVQLYQPG